MADNFNQNEFEAFLQDQVRNHRMYPSDSVWREIDRKLHGERRWPALTVAASLLLTATVLICVYFSPKPNIFSIPAANVNTSTQPSQKNNILNNIIASTPFAGEKHSYKGPVQNVSDEVSLPTSSDISASTQEPEANIISPEVVANNNIPLPQTHIAIPSITKISNHITQTRTQLVSGNEKIVSDVKNETSLSSKNASVAVSSTNKDVAVNKSKTSGDGSSTKDYNDKNMVDEFLKEHKNDIPLHTTAKNRTVKNKFSYQVYAAPSVSYRKLLEDNSLMKENSSGGPVGLNYVADVNKVVRHKPGTGIELGLSFMYSLSNTVRVKSGFQFNMRQYSIEAYRSSNELASIALLQNNRFDTVNTLSFYRTNNGYYSAELVNRYYQLSVPVGVEWEIIGSKKIRLNVAGTIQPTYLLNRNAYLLSTNFKNYTESPGMVRQWNLNSNIEAFISFKAGDLKWQLGPQLRYQPYSTFIPQYPIKEHLMDYGIKLGVSRVLN